MNTKAPVPHRVSDFLMSAAPALTFASFFMLVGSVYVLYSIDLQNSFERSIFNATDAQIAREIADDGIALAELKKTKNGTSAPTAKRPKAKLAPEDYVLYVHSKIKTINPQVGVYSLVFSVKPSRAFYIDRADHEESSAAERMAVFDDTVELPVLKHAFIFTSRTFKKTFLVGTIVPHFLEPIEIPFKTATLMAYPFDEYHGFFDVSATLLPPRSDNALARHRGSLRITVNVVLNVQVGGFKLLTAPQRTGAMVPHYVALLFSIVRNRITMGFSIFITLLSWILSSFISFMTLQVWYRGRSIPSAMLGLPIGLLFSLPMLRNVQPLSPPYGAMMDVLGFFWNMVIVAVCSITLIVLFIIRWRP